MLNKMVDASTIVPLFYALVPLVPIRHSCKNARSFHCSVIIRAPPNFKLVCTVYHIVSYHITADVLETFVLNEQVQRLV